jgi:hypothetical protein
MPELTDRQRKWVFAGLVVALAFVGIYLTLPSSSSSSPQTTKPSASTGPEAPAAGPTTPPPGISSTITAGNFDIYRLLPFKQQEFATAADVAQRFMVAYETYSYNEAPQAYMARLQPLVTSDLATQLAAAANTPGVLDQRKQDQEVAQGTASIDSIRTFQPNSIIFLVTGHQQVQKVSGSTQVDQQFAVTVARSAGSWTVYALEPAETGQAGDTGAGQ